MSNRAAQPLAAEPRVPRHKVFLPAEMSDENGPARVHLLNISLTGALVHGDAAPRAGAVVQLRCADANWLARVVWSQDKRFGVVHVAPLAPAVVDALVAGRRAA